MHSKVSGIDEAGRGSVFGSLFIVGVTLNQEPMNKLVKNGLKDSKLFSGQYGKKKRAKLAVRIQELALESKITEIPANEIDQTLSNRPYDNLNLLEIRKIAQIVISLSSNEIIIDSISKPKYFLKHLTSHLGKLEKSFSFNIESLESRTSSFHIIKPDNQIKRVIISEKADQTAPVVSAASCVAKYLRDNHLREIEEHWKLPPSILGQGYPNEKDQNVMNFLQTYHNNIKRRQFPFIRYSWSWPPLQQIIKSPSKTLENYIDNGTTKGEIKRKNDKNKRSGG